MTEKVLGKIETASYGFGSGDGSFGLFVTLSLRGGGTGVTDFKGGWARYSEGAKYSRVAWERTHLNTALEIIDLLSAAKKNDVAKLVGTPIEAEIDGNALKSWRILTEVL